MAALLFLAPLLLLGTARAQAGTEGCPLLVNVTGGNFSVETTPRTYQANRTYTVTIRDSRDHSNSSMGQYLLQALSPQNSSVGQWQEGPTRNCSFIDTAVLNITQNATRWTSPESNLTWVQIRVYLSLPDKATELQTFMLNEGADPTTVPPTTPSSAPAARSISLPLAALQLPLLLLTGKLLS